MRIVAARLDDPADAAAYRDQLAAYALDPLGGACALPESTLHRVCEDLARMPHAHAFLARLDEVTVGFATCFEGYSTFRGQSLWNIHDIAVIRAFRGQGIGRALLQHIARSAQAAGCCKLTLEVREDNPGAARLYRNFGFHTAHLADGGQVQYLFLEHSLQGRPAK
jgi:ribosomal protein S18 acetylase RimI-like enzyme